MNIKETSKELNKKEQYLLTLNNAMISVKDVEDRVKITCTAYALYDDINSKGEEVEVLTILTPDNTVYCTQSATFKRSFKDIYDMMNPEEFTVIKVSGTTKAGRPYVDCQLDTEGL